jgi:hypothetical protein
MFVGAICETISERKAESGGAPMALVQEHGHIAPHPSSAEHIDRLRLREKIGTFFELILAGMVASKDYRHLNGMTDQQLRAIGLARRDIPKEINRRHLSVSHRDRQG